MRETEIRVQLIDNLICVVPQVLRKNCFCVKSLTKFVKHTVQSAQYATFAKMIGLFA